MGAHGKPGSNSGLPLLSSILLSPLLDLNLFFDNFFFLFHFLLHVFCLYLSSTNFCLAFLLPSSFGSFLLYPCPVSLVRLWNVGGSVLINLLTCFCQALDSWCPHRYSLAVCGVVEYI